MTLFGDHVTCANHSSYQRLEIMEYLADQLREMLEGCIREGYGKDDDEIYEDVEWVSVIIFDLPFDLIIYTLCQCIISAYASARQCQKWLEKALRVDGNLVSVWIT
jgi:DNA-binding IclR family transcriptional regulator